jgi:hypothetical protein
MEELMSERAPSLLSVPARPRVVVLGDSIASGLGVRENSFGRIAARELGAGAILFKAKVRRMIDESAELLPRILDFNPDLVIMSSGNAEAVVHPGKTVEDLLTRYGPKGWQGDSGLEPRPFYSDEFAKRVRQRITSVTKVVLKNIFIRLGSGYSRMSLEEYVPRLEVFLDALTERGCAVVLAGIADVDPLLFPKSGTNVDRFDAAQRRIVASRPQVRLLRLRQIIDARTEVLADKAHPNLEGHQHIAREIRALLAVREVPDADLARTR